jgi:hypothetical protein
MHEADLIPLGRYAEANFEDGSFEALERIVNPRTQMQVPGWLRNRGFLIASGIANAVLAVALVTTIHGQTEDGSLSATRIVSAKTHGSSLVHVGNWDYKMPLE